MIMALVLGPVVSTIKDPSFVGHRILLCQPVDDKGKSQGPTLLAFDSVQAGPGDMVLIIREGNGCRQIWNNDQAPVNSVVAGIIDQISQ